MIRFNFPTKLHEDWERWLLIKGTETNSESQKERNRSVYRWHSGEKKKSASARDTRGMGSTPVLGRSPGVGNGNLLQ